LLQNQSERTRIKQVGVFPCEILEKEEREIFFAGIKAWDVKIHTQITSEINALST